MHPSLVLRACVSWQPSCLLPSLYRWCAYKCACVCVGGGSLQLLSHICQGVVHLHMCCVEHLWPGSKLNQANKALFWELIKGLRSPPNCKNQRIKNTQLQFDLWPIKSSNQAHFLLIKNLDPGRKCFSRRHTPWFGCVCVRVFMQWKLTSRWMTSFQLRWFTGHLPSPFLQDPQVQIPLTSSPVGIFYCLLSQYVVLETKLTVQGGTEVTLWRHVVTQ